MIRTLTFSLFCLAAAAAPAQVLFNGKNLDGWDGNPELWRVEDGVIIGETTKEKPTKGNSFLIWKGGEIGDFTLTLKARVTGNNSGIQYRSKIFDAKKWSVGGYQMDMHPAPKYLGMLYEERGRGIAAQRGQKVTLAAGAKPQVTGEVDASKKLDLAAWNEFTVTARGNHLVHKVNGDVTVEITDNDAAKRAMKGVLALQLHAGAPMKVEIKDIVLKKLKEGAKKAPKKDTYAAAPTALAPVPTPRWIWKT
jgi:hypothetical protein